MSHSRSIRNTNTYRDAIDRIMPRIAALHDQAFTAAEIEIKRRLHLLNERFPRHKFTLLDGMGCTFVTVTPNIFNEQNIHNSAEVRRRLMYHPVESRFKATLDFLWEQIDAIISVSDEMGEKFNMEMGIIEKDQ